MNVWADVGRYPFDHRCSVDLAKQSHRTGYSRSRISCHTTTFVARLEFTDFSYRRRQLIFALCASDKDAAIDIANDGAASLTYPLPAVIDG